MPAATALKAISEPRRLEILRLIAADELSSGQIAAHFEVSHPAVSQHLRVLTDAGLASVRREGTRRFYRVRPEGLEELRAFLEEYWDSGLRRLAAAAEAEELGQAAGRPPDMNAIYGILQILGDAKRKDGIHRRTNV